MCTNVGENYDVYYEGFSRHNIQFNIVNIRQYPILLSKPCNFYQAYGDQSRIIYIYVPKSYIYLIIIFIEILLNLLQICIGARRLCIGARIGARSSFIGAFC